MSRPTRFDDEALDEIIEAARQYEQREPGLGASFAEVVLARVERLSRFPNAGAPVWGVNGALLARQVRIRTYPYLVVYVVTDSEIRVVSVAHERRTPMYWSARL